MPLSEVPSFVIGTVRIPQRAGIDLRNQYQDLEGAGIVRFSNGSTKKVTIWNGKIRMSVTGSGALPAGIQSGVLDHSIAHTIKSFAPRAIPSTSNVIVVPAARRTDLSQQVLGVAVLSEFEAVETPVSLVSNTATLTTVVGAVSYEAIYFPQFSGYLTEHEETIDRRQQAMRWRIEITEE